MTENMKKFLEAVSKDEALREKVNTMDKDAIIATAKELGIELTETDFAQPEGEMNTDELDAVAGGGVCACVTAGGGKAGGYDKACGCYILGGGDGTGSNGLYARCFCVYGGGGEVAEGPKTTNYDEY